MDWTVCIICQSIKEEDLRCPINKKGDYKAVYSKFIDNVSEFRKLDRMPVELLFEDSMSSNVLIENAAKWHHNCHQKFTTSRLNRVRDKLFKCDSSHRKSMRNTLEIDKYCCLFCGKSKDLISFATLNAEYKVRQMAKDLDDIELQTKISGGDFVALEIKYHLQCLTAYRNQHYINFTCKNTEDTNSDYKGAKTRVLTALFSHIDDEIQGGKNVFYFKKLREFCEQQLLYLGFEVELNKNNFKNKILTNYEDFGIQELYDGYRTVFTFPEGVTNMMKETLFDPNDTAQLIMKVSKIVRSELFSSSIMFNGKLSGTNFDFIPVTRNLVSTILYGNTDKSDERVTNTMSELFLFNAKKDSRTSETTHSRHNLSREPLFPLYMGLSIHSETRCKTMIDKLSKFGLSVSYKRVADVEDLIFHNICKQYDHEGVVCPRQLRKGIYTIGALDNLDHNPSSTTAEGSFHGTAISIIQPRANGIIGEERIITFDTGPFEDDPELPESFTLVPAISMKQSSIKVPPAPICKEIESFIDIEIEKEYKWINDAIEYLEKDTVAKRAISWSAYHASLQPPPSPTYPNSIIAMLPLFFEKADSPSMIKHGMGILKKISEFLNPGQLPILACDCPIFAQLKYIQWNWPLEYGENKFIAMFGGMHIEKALMTCLGDLLHSSGWVKALVQASIATEGKADSLLKAAHIMRTRQSHHITALSLAILRQEAYSSICTTQPQIPFSLWCKQMKASSPTFFFWDLILQIQIKYFIFVRAHRQRNFNLYIEVLESLMFLFFGLDHHNYSRWLSVHLRDMKSLTEDVRIALSENWTVHKTHHRFSDIPLDQAHEQENAKLKGKGGVVGLTENPSALRKWVITGPEVSRLVDEFEHLYLTDKSNDVDYNSNYYQHHDENLYSQENFKEKTLRLVEVIKDYGNPFTDDCNELLVLDSRDCTSETVISSVKRIETLGKDQYYKFISNVLESGEKSIHDPIKKNSLSLFRTPKPRKQSKSSQIKDLRNDVSLFGRLYIANQQRDGDPDIFFAHENQLHPPSLSNHGRLRTGTKSDLMKCLRLIHVQERVTYDCKIFDGGALVHLLDPKMATTFQEYAVDVVLSLIKNELTIANRVDIVWDRYIPNSLKESTREKRGCGIRRKVGAKTRIPPKWRDFLRNSENKVELFAFLNQILSQAKYPEGKHVYLTSDELVISSTAGIPMPSCNHEEADYRIVVHVIHAIESGSMKIIVRSNDTDVVVILISHFFTFYQLNCDMKLWVAFGIDKHYALYSVNDWCLRNTYDLCYSLPVFHAFTGSDTTSAFLGKGKLSAWNTLKIYPEILKTFRYIRDNPFCNIEMDSDIFTLFQRYVILLYDRSSNLQKVNQARRELFCKKGRNLENIPPTEDALFLHVKRAIYQASIWFSANKNHMSLPSPQLFGWKNDNGIWIPHWTTMSEAALACKELIKCSHSGKRECGNCSCSRAGLPCTDLCNCLCEK